MKNLSLYNYLYHVCFRGRSILNAQVHLASNILSVNTWSMTLDFLVRFEVPQISCSVLSRHVQGQTPSAPILRPLTTARSHIEHISAVALPNL